MSDTGAKPLQPPRTAYAVITTLFALLLLVAAGLKADAALTEGQGPFQKELAAAAAEAAIAVWLLSGVGRVWARRAAVVLLLAFVTLAGRRLVRGDADCGCFGRVRIHPALTLGVDLAALSSIWLLGRWTSVSAGAGPGG